MPDKTDKALQTTSADRYTTLRLGEAKDGALAGNANVEVDDELGTAAQRNAVNRADDGLAIGSVGVRGTVRTE
jgi:hypothetical protein